MTESEVEARTRASAIRTFSWTIKHPGIKGDAVVLPLKDWDYLIDKGVGLAVARAEVERLRGVVADAEQAKRAVLKWANSCHHVGCECDNTLADELPDDWMAVAALEEGE